MDVKKDVDVVTDAVTAVAIMAGVLLTEIPVTAFSGSSFSCAAVATMDADMDAAVATVVTTAG